MEHHIGRGVYVSHFQGDDGALVVQIDTLHEDAGHIRVNLNDAPIYNGNPEEGPYG